MAEIAELRREVTSLRRDSDLALKMLGILLKSVHALNRHENSIEHSINDIAKEISDLHGDRGQTHTHCPNCGAPLEHHAATAGDLQICVACSWSQFIDRSAGPLPATFPAPPPAKNAAPLTWVD